MDRPKGMGEHMVHPMGEWGVMRMEQEAVAMERLQVCWHSLCILAHLFAISCASTLLAGSMIIARFLVAVHGYYTHRLSECKNCQPSCACDSYVHFSSACAYADMSCSGGHHLRSSWARPLRLEVEDA